MALLNLLKSKAESSKLEPKISMQRVVELMRAQGHSFNYAIFTDLAQDPAISNLVADYNKQSVTINAEGAEDEKDEADVDVDTNDDDEDVEVEKQRDTVKDMAKRSLSRRR